MEKQYQNGTTYARLDNERIFSVLRELREENPKAKAERLRRLYIDEVINNPDLMLSFVEMFYPNVCAIVEKETAKPKKRKRLTREQKTEQTRKYINSRVLDYVMLNGKKLRECTFGYCAEVGGRFSKLATMGGPDELVSKLTQKQVRAALLP